MSIGVNDLTQSVSIGVNDLTQVVSLGVVGETPNPLPTSFVAKKKGTDYSVLLFSIPKVYASLSSRALQVGFADP